MGQSVRSQGEQSTPVLTETCQGAPGFHPTGSVGPNRVTVGTAKLAARWRGPQSVPTNKRARGNKWAMIECNFMGFIGGGQGNGCWLVEGEEIRLLVLNLDFPLKDTLNNSDHSFSPV